MITFRKSTTPAPKADESVPQHAAPNDEDRRKKVASDRRAKQVDRIVDENKLL